MVYEQQELLLLLLLMLMEQLKLKFYVSRTDTLSEVLERHKNVFQKKLGIIERFKTDIKLQDVAKPVFCKARPVPYAWCHNVEKDGPVGES